MSIALLLISGWYGARLYFEHKHPDWTPADTASVSQDTATQPSTTPTTSTVAETPTTGATVASTTGPSIGAPAGIHPVPPTSPPRGVLIGSAEPNDKTYAMQVSLSAEGAGVDQVTLNEYRQSVKKPDRYSFQQPYADFPGSAPFASDMLVINGNSVNISGPWTLEASDSNAAAVYSKLLAEGDKPLLRLTKKFVLADKSSPSKGYELQFLYSVENLSGTSIKVQADFNGPTVPHKEVERGADRQLILGYQKGDTDLTVSQHLVEEYKDGTKHDLSTLDNQKVLWGGAGSAYFSAIVVPNYPANQGTKTDYSVHAEWLTPGDAKRHDIALDFRTSDLVLAAGEVARLPASIFMGPKKRDLLDLPYYADMPRAFNKTLVIASGPCGICTFTPLINLLVKMLWAFHKVTYDWGIAIIILVLIVRVLLHPITKRSQVQMMKMGKMGPEMERLKKKYADDKDALNKAMMQVYKEQGMAPVLGCLPMFLQMPIWIALWTALQSTFELRQSPFLWFGPVHLTWISDLANPDALIAFPAFDLPFIGEINSFNILPLLLAVVFYLQQKYTPKPVAASPEQEQQQKMMTWMSTLMFPIFLYKGPAGLNLYILTSTTIGIIESKVIRKHIKEREEAEKAERVIVDMRPTRQARLRDDTDQAEPKKPGKIMGWLADLQAKAEQIRREGTRGK